MTSFTLFVALTAFLTGGAAAIFLMIVIGIRKADHPRRPPAEQEDPMGAFTRSALSAGIWPNGPACDDRKPE